MACVTSPVPPAQWYPRIPQPLPTATAKASKTAQPTQPRCLCISLQKRGEPLYGLVVRKSLLRQIDSVKIETALVNRDREWDDACWKRDAGNAGHLPSVVTACNGDS